MKILPFVFLLLVTYPVFALSNKDQKLNSVRQKKDEIIQVTPLENPERSGGIGEQVREIARNQKEAQNKLQENYENLQSRPEFLKSIFGANQNSNLLQKVKVEKNKGIFRHIWSKLSDFLNLYL